MNFSDPLGLERVCVRDPGSKGIRSRRCVDVDSDRELSAAEILAIQQEMYRQLGLRPRWDGTGDPPGLGHILLTIAGKVWAAPVTAVGVVYGGIGHIVGWLMGTNPSVSLGHNAVQFADNPFVRGAITLGNTIVYGRGIGPGTYGAYGNPLANFGYHEEAHTYQYQVLGPLYFFAYMFHGGFFVPWHQNPYEVAAQKYAITPQGRNWWPR